MTINPGSIISTANPGEHSGTAAPPANVGNIMQNMFSQMVTPEQVADPSKPQVTQQPTAAPANNPVVLTEPKKETVQINPATEPDVNLFTEAPVEETQPAAPVEEEPDMSDIPDEPAKENWKKAREALKTERKNARLLAKERDEFKTKFEKYERGEAIPEVLTAKDIKIKELEKYETIVNGKLSDAYQTIVAKPINEKSGELNKLAEDYQVPENIRGALVQRIVETENEKDRNALITKYFPDAIGATKVQGLVKELHELGQKAIDIEKEPAKVMQDIQTQYQIKKQKEAEVVASQFESVSKVSWTKALEKTSQEGLFPELIMDPTNAEHSKVAEKNQHRAGIQYGALVKKLHENGLKTLPEDLATGLARSVQLAIGSVGVAKKLAAAEARIAELEGAGGMMATYLRPGVNSNGRGNAPVNTGNDKGPANPQQAGAMAAAVFKK